ncbi:retropepsin-like aspartic protease [Marinifilum sp. RC60d5]|uniref:retropepsin-like aspartic protease n=1 Tax=Marinifilum sp. RC60d5 TaxID=3458414 RepID=UPI0040357E8C
MDFEIPIEIIELENNSYHLLVKCKINSSQEGDLVIDTGASKTVLDKNFVDIYEKTEQDEAEMQSRGLGEGSIETQMGKIENFQIGELIVENFSCALIDLSGINEMYQQYCERKICGLLGSDFLLEHRGIINYREKNLKFESF